VIRFSFQRFQLNDLASSAIILILIALISHSTNIFGRVDDLIFDVGQSLFKIAPPEDVVIIAIDQESLSQLGRWPWSRGVHAQLLNRLKSEAPAVIGFDIIFAEPELSNPQADEALAHAFSEADNVVLPVLLETVRENGQMIETLPLPVFMHTVKDVGRIHANLDEDSIARSVYLYEGLGSPVWQLFSQAVLNVANKTSTRNRFEYSEAENSFNSFALVRKDKRRVNFLGPPGHFSQVSYAQVLKGDFLPGMFKDKILLVGATALGMNDLLTTPVSGLSLPMAGVEFNANVLQSIRTNSLIIEVHFGVSMMVMLLVSVLPLFWMPKVSALSGFLSTILFMIFLGLFSGVLPKVVGVWIPPSAALVSILLAYPIWSWRKLEATQRFLDFELNMLRKKVKSLPEKQSSFLFKGYDKFNARIEQVRSASKQLDFLNEERKETLAFISHDLRAPIAAALLELDQHQGLKTKLYKPLSQALHLAEDFLHASHAEIIDSSQFSEVDFPGLVHQAIDDAYQASIDKKVVLERSILEEVVWVSANFSLLHRAILNLILNAVKYSQQNSTVLITVSLLHENTQVLCEVTNDGPGISEADQLNLFKRFSRIKGHEKMAGGSGLGLYFVSTVAAKHMGHIQVKSELQKPTTFSLSLPVIAFESAFT
jgi:CHASE2 domain-containing sensor protein